MTNPEVQAHDSDYVSVYAHVDVHVTPTSRRGE
jgi:hypothetical protein